MNDVTSAETDDLYAAILSLQSPAECARFLGALLTTEEQADLVDRWAVVKLVADGHSYRTITALRGSSSRTIRRAKVWLDHEDGGFRLVLGRLGTTKQGKRDVLRIECQTRSHS